MLEGNVTADDRKVPFTITLSAVSGVDVSGTISTTSGTATEGTDFESADGFTFVIPAGQTQATILVSVIEDTTFEPDEQFTIAAAVFDPSTVSNSSATASGTGTIENDDAVPTLSINDISLNEGVSGITAYTFTVTLSANPSSNVTVTLNTADGTTNPATTADNDYAAISGLVLTFVPNGPLTQTVTVNVAGDSKFERDETFFVNLSSPTGATLADGQGLGTIQNDDLAPTLSFSTNNSVLEGNVTADDRKVPFTVTLFAISGVDVVGTISTTGGTAIEGTDFESADGVAFVIPAGQLQATILVSVIEDTTFEPDEQFGITATASDVTTVGNSGGTASGTGTIENDDSPPTLSIDDISLNEGASGITSFTFTVTLSANPSSNVTVTLTTANGATNPATTADNDYSAISGLVLTFIPNGPLTQTVTVDVAGDSKFERDETFFVNLSSPTGATLADGQGLGTIQNDDLAPTLSFSSTNSVLEGNVTADDRKVPFTISLSAISGVDVTGTISTTSGTASEGTDFVSADGVSFVIPAGQLQATILVSVIEDTTFEPDEQFTIAAAVFDPSTVSNSGATASGTGTIENDDAVPTLSINDISQNEGVSGITAYTFTVTLSASPSSNVIVTVNTADGTTNPATTADNDYAAISNLVLTFVPNGPLTQTVTVNVAGDSKFERNETFFVNLSSPTGATLADGQGLGTIQNDDLAPTLSFSTNNSVLEGNVGADDRKVPFTVTLSAVSGVDVTGTISTTSGTASEGTDFVSADGVAFLIPAGQTQATIFVSVIEDTDVEANEQFTIDATVTDLTTVSNSNGLASGTGTILNDDAAGDPQVSIGPGCHGPALIIQGSQTADTIRVVAHGRNAVKVLINGQDFGIYALSGFVEIIAYGKDGNDDIELAGRISTPAFLFGEAGNDRLKGGNGANVLVGEAGDDYLIGSQGADVLIGGVGADRLVGNGGDDLLIAGWTDHDTNLAALCAIVDEWSRTDGVYEDRVNNLRFGSGLNGSVLLNSQTVHDDGDFDQLTGSAGRDWFFANLDFGVLDQITDWHSSEQVDEIN
jgi:Ca2+-binding RTX toxin-like protein